MKNRKYIFAVACAFLIGPCAMAQRATAKKPNIIFIFADDLGYGDLGVYGQKLIKTPNLDKLAASGMRFTQFYAGSPVCSPSRSTLLTGLHSGHTYIRGNRPAKPEGQEPLADSVFTIAELLKQAGYTTGAFGKWGSVLSRLRATRSTRASIISTDTIAKPLPIDIIPSISGKTSKKWCLTAMAFQTPLFMLPT